MISPMSLQVFAKMSMMMFCLVLTILIGVRADSDSKSKHNFLWKDDHIHCNESQDPIQYVLQYLRLCAPDCNNRSYKKEGKVLLWNQLFDNAVYPCLQHKRYTLYCKGLEDSRCSQLFEVQRRESRTLTTSAPQQTSTAEIRNALCAPEVSMAGSVGLLLLGIFIGVAMATVICLCCPVVHSQVSGRVTASKEKVRRLINKKRTTSIIMQEASVGTVTPPRQSSGIYNEAIYNEPSRIHSTYDTNNQPVMAVDTNDAANQNVRHENTTPDEISNPNYSQLYTESGQENRYSTLDIDGRRSTIDEPPPTRKDSEPHHYFVLEKGTSSSDQTVPSAPVL